MYEWECGATQHDSERLYKIKFSLKLPHLVLSEISHGNSHTRYACRLSMGSGPGGNWSIYFPVQVFSPSPLLVMPGSVPSQ